MPSPLRKQSRANEPLRTLALPPGTTVAPLMRLAERRPPQRRRLRELPGVPASSQLVLRPICLR